MFSIGCFVLVASPARPGGDSNWLWVERASWLAAIAGLVVVLLALAQLRALVKRPKLKVGFHQDPGGTGTRLLRTVESISTAVHWNPGIQLSEPTKLWVVVVNESTASATAHDVNVEARYPKWLVPEGMGDLKQPPGMDVWAISKQDVTLNPGVAFWLRGTFRIPRGHDRVHIHAIASMRDSRTIEKMLTVVLEEA